MVRLRFLQLLYSRNRKSAHGMGGLEAQVILRLRIKSHPNVKGPIVLLDDVCTSGGHMIGAHWKLHHPPRRQIVLACAFGRTTKEQLTHPVGIRVEELDTTPPFD